MNHNYTKSNCNIVGNNNNKMKNSNSNNKRTSFITITNYCYTIIEK